MTPESKIVVDTATGLIDGLGAEDIALRARRPVTEVRAIVAELRLRALIVPLATSGAPGATARALICAPRREGPRHG